MRLTPELIIQSYLCCNHNALQTSLLLDIDIRTVRRWVKRSKNCSGRICIRKIKKYSTVRKDKGYVLSFLEERRIVFLRKFLGLDQSKIAFIFSKETGIKVSGKTVYNILKRRSPNLLHKKPNYRRPRFQNGIHMRPSNTKSPGYLQLDVKYITPELSGLSYTTYEYGFIDIYSRYKIAFILPSLGEQEAILCVKWVIQQAPFKIKFIQTDNGWEWGKTFHKECLSKEIEHYYIHKSSPNENAVIERSFRTDQDEFFFFQMVKPKDINDLTKQYQKYLYWYNNDRPHFGLNLNTPVQYINNYYKLAI